MSYYIHRNGQQTGPFAEEQVRQMLAAGLADSGDLCWHDGLTTWISLSQAMGQTPPDLPPAPPQTQFAGFWLRAIALVLDTFILLVPGWGIGFVIGAMMGSQGASKDDVVGVCYIVGIVIWWLYYACMESSSLQATFGKLALGIRVTDVTGRRISFGRAAGRNLAKVISGMLFGIGFMMAGFDARKQALHDGLAGCLVCRK
jgi:uncharacterized RDD family membrane protein YckC